jgi:F0F1-type ATP synthase membrane subunit c/vacuolar-type H+-ATPase subunit K
MRGASKGDNNMFLTVFPLASVAAVIGVVVALAYPFACKAVERHIATAVPDSDEDEIGALEWYQRRCALDRVRLGIAVCSFASFASGMFSLAGVHSTLETAGTATQAHWILIIVLTVSMWIVGGLSQLHFGYLRPAAARSRRG